MDFFLKHYLQELLTINDKYPLKRELYHILVNEIQNRNICLVGLRQVGKTTLMLQLANWYYEHLINMDNNSNNLIRSSIINKQQKVFYTNLKSLKGTYINENDFKQSLFNSIVSQQYELVILDEIQEIDNWSDFLQAAIDLNKKARFIVSSSNANALINEIMVGRISIYYVKPLLFNEYINIWNNNDLTSYLLYGSYPKNKNYDDCFIQYSELVKDIIIDKIIYDDYKNNVDYDKFYSLLNDINNHIGNEINTNKLINNVTRQTLPHYLNKMHQAQLIKNCYLFHDKNQRRKIKIYFEDKSMIYYFNHFQPLNNNQIGSLVENVVFNYLDYSLNSTNNFNEINYYRNQNGLEIDFVIASRQTLIEVKYVDNKHFDLDSIIKQVNELKNQKLSLKDYKLLIISKNINRVIDNKTSIISLDLFLRGQYEW